MSTIILSGQLGPTSALALRDRLALESFGPRPQIHVDLSSAESVHVSVVAALVRIGREAKRHAGGLSVTFPTSRAARECFRLTNLVDER